MKKGILYYLHKLVDKTIGYERGMYECFCGRTCSDCNDFVVIIRVHVTFLRFLDFEII